MGGASTLLARTVLLVGALTILVGCVDCMDFGQVVYFDRDPDEAVLDVDHPAVEQQVTLHINAAALPTAGTTVGTLIVQAGRGAVPKFTLIRTDTNEVVPNTTPAGGTSVGHSSDVAMAITLDCPMGADCDRAYRLRVTAPSLNSGPFSAAWQVAVQFTYTGVKGICGTPGGAKVTVEAASPEVLPAPTAP